MALDTLWEDFFAHDDARPPRPFAVDAFNRIEPGGLAIDLGCGQGTETAELLRRGWSVLAVDAEPAAVARVARLIEPSSGRLTVRQASFADLTELPRSRLVHAGFSLPFCPLIGSTRCGPRSPDRCERAACSPASCSATGTPGPGPRPAR